MKKAGLRTLYFCLALIITLSLAAGSVYATNGYFAHGYSIKNKSLAGAGTALALDSLSASTNPAAMALVGNRLDLGLSVFNPNREYTVTGSPSGPPYFGLAQGTIVSTAEWFVIPGFGYNRMMDENYSLGVSVYGNGGMNTDYSTNTFYGSNPTGVDLMQLFIVPTYARKINSKHAIGFSPIIAYQRFMARGLEQFESSSFEPTKLTNNGYESAYGLGARVGYLGEVMPGLRVGASYQTRILMNEFDKYAGLFAEHGDFDIPPTWNVGVAYDIIPALTAVFDIQAIYYSDIDSVGNPLLPNIATPATPLGTDKGAGFGWEDMIIFKAGVQWASNEEWTWRAGYSYGEQPIPSSEMMFNILAPGVIEQHVTAGFTKKLPNNQEIDVSVMRALSNDISGPNTMEAPGAQTITLEMDQWEFSVGYSKSF
ncbi:MAG: outer membrane protein transport protein [Nitrospirae bacterium]|nr:outer membrane protein transport protein [Nitrospirota bacterium]